MNYPSGEEVHKISKNTACDREGGVLNVGWGRTHADIFEIREQTAGCLFRGGRSFSQITHTQLIALIEPGSKSVNFTWISNRNVQTGIKSILVSVENCSKVPFIHINQLSVLELYVKQICKCG